MLFFISKNRIELDLYFASQIQTNKQNRNLEILSNVNAIHTFAMLDILILIN